VNAPLSPLCDALKRRASKRRTRIGCADSRVLHLDDPSTRLQTCFGGKKFWVVNMSDAVSVRARRTCANRRPSSPEKRRQEISKVPESRILSTLSSHADFSLRNRGDNELFRTMFSESALQRAFERARRGVYTEN
jgi:hypothetical protein